MNTEQEYNRPGWLQGWYTFDDKLRKFERGLLVVGLFTILIVGSIHILARNLIGQGLAFSDVLAQHLTVWLGLLGATLAAASSEHISIDAFSRVLRHRGLQVNKLIIGAVSTIFCGILTYRTIVFLIFAIKQGESVHLGNVNVPLWYFLLIFPYTFGLITLRYLMQTIEYGLRPAHSFINEQDMIKAESEAQGPEPGVEADKVDPDKHAASEHTLEDSEKASEGPEATSKTSEEPKEGES